MTVYEIVGTVGMIGLLIMFAQSLKSAYPKEDLK